MTSVIGCPIVLVQDLLALANFLSKLLQPDEQRAFNQPVPHILLTFSDTSTIVVMAKEYASLHPLHHVRATTSTSICVSMAYTEVLRLSTSSAATGMTLRTLPESQSSSNNGVGSGRTNGENAMRLCLTVPGPEEVLLHILTMQGPLTAPRPYELLMMTTSSDRCPLDDVTAGPSASPSNTTDNANAPRKSRGHSASMQAAGLTPRQPQSPFKTLRADILTNQSLDFVTIAPNYPEPVPFETELFEGRALLMIRTDPLDKRFQTVFEGSK